MNENKLASYHSKNKLKNKLAYASQLTVAEQDHRGHDPGRPRLRGRRSAL